ncbi:MAG: hypothetical protein JWM32_291 [Verrucomicrobia bacterium]|nr:hypothetical protein [Verrucomicrobiota bacterium]
MGAVSGRAGRRRGATSVKLTKEVESQGFPSMKTAPFPFALALVFFAGCSSPNRTIPPPQAYNGVSRATFIADETRALEKKGRPHEAAIRQAISDWDRSQSYSTDNYAYDRQQAERRASREKMENDLAKLERERKD